MKAVILENRDGYSAILREDGVVEKVKQRGEVGDTIIVNPEKRRRTAQIYRFAQVAAAAMFFLVAGGTVRHFAFVPSSYVTMDVNPSVEFAMNRMDRVIDVSAVNEDAEEVVSSLKEGHVWGRSLEELIGETTQLLEEYEYLNSSEDVVLFAVATDSDDVYDKISARVLDAESSNKGLTVEVIRGGKEDHDRAGELSLSVGRYLKMMESISGTGDSSGDAGKTSKAEPDNRTVSEFRQMPVEEILGKGMSENGSGTVAQGQNGTQPDAAAGGQAGSQPGNQGGGQAGSQPGNQGGGQAGAQPGNQGAGQPAGQPENQGGGQTGEQSGTQEGGQAGVQPGTQEGGQAGSQPGTQEGGQAGSQPGNQGTGQTGEPTGDQGAGQTGNQPGEQIDNQGNGQSAGQGNGQPAAEPAMQETGQSEGLAGSEGRADTQAENSQGPGAGSQTGMQMGNQQGTAQNGQPEMQAGGENSGQQEGQAGDRQDVMGGGQPNQ